MAGSSVSASGINALFTSLESARIAHAAGKTQNSTSLSTSFNNYKVTAGTQAKPDVVTNIKQCLTTLATSRYMNGTNYGTSITTPTSGTLMVETLFNTAQTQVNAAAAVCVHDSSYNASYDGSYHGSYNGSHRGSYDSSYDSSYNGSHRGSYDGSHRDSYDGSHMGGYNASYQAVKTTYNYNNDSYYNGNGVICTGVR